MVLKLKNWLIGLLSLLEERLNSLLKTLTELIWKFRGWLMKMIIWWTKFSLKKAPFSISRSKSSSIWIMRTKLLKNSNLIKIKFSNKKKKLINIYFNFKVKSRVLKFNDSNYKITMSNNAANLKSKSYHWKTSTNNYNNSTSRSSWTSNK